MKIGHQKHKSSEPIHESSQTRRIKNERKNWGKTYKEYLAEEYGAMKTRKMLGIAKTLKI